MTKKQYRSIFISDVHLGTKHCQAEKLLEFLKSTDADYYYLVGDIVDGWMMRHKVYWPESHNNVVQFFLKKAKKACAIVYVTGNHDDFLRHHSSMTLGNITLVDEHIHYGIDGKRYLLMHGDQFDIITMNASWLTHLGSHAYDWLISLNTLVQKIMRVFGKDGFSISKWAKYKVKEAVQFIGNYQDVVAQHAKNEKVDGIICGHIHHANIFRFLDDQNHTITYINCGDWVESCTAIVEHTDGTFEIIRR